MFACPEAGQTNSGCKIILYALLVGIHEIQILGALVWPSRELDSSWDVPVKTHNRPKARVYSSWSFLCPISLPQGNGESKGAQGSHTKAQS